MIKILDLFAGIGGSALGIKRVLRENQMEYLYVGVDIDRQVLRAHKIINPDTELIQADAYSLPDDFLIKFDFIWASPPCETHSRLCFKRRRNQNRRPKPDFRLWELIRRLRKLNIPFIVENVQPYYGFILKPTLKVWRHCFWSNLPLVKPELKFPRWYHIHNSKKLLIDFFGFPNQISKYVTREMLRDCTHPKIAYELFRQFLFIKTTNCIYKIDI